LHKRIRFVSLLLWMTVIFPVYGQGDPSALDLPNDWHPRTPYLYNPYKSDQPSLVMPYDSLNLFTPGPDTTAFLYRTVNSNLQGLVYNLIDG